MLNLLSGRNTWMTGVNGWVMGTFIVVVSCVAGWMCAMHPAWVLPFLAVLVAAPFVLSEPILLFCMIVALAPSEAGMPIIPGLISVAKPTASVLALLLLVRKRLMGENLVILPELRLGMGFAVYCAVSLLWSSFPPVVLDGTIRMAGMVLLLWLATETVRTPGHLTAVFHFAALGVAVPAFWARSRMGTQTDLLSRESGILGADANELAMFGNIAILFVLLRLPGAKGWERLLLISYLPIILAGLAIGQSRSGLLGLVLALGYLGYRNAHRFQFKRVVLGVIGVVAALAIVNHFVPLNEIVEKRIVDETLEAEDPSTRRLGIWKTGLYMFVKRPILGSGFYTFPYSYQRDSLEAGVGMDVGRKRDAHNSYVRLIVELGVVGLLWMAIAVTVLVRLLGRIPNGFGREVCIALLIVCATSGMFITNYYNKGLWLVVALLLLFATRGRELAPWLFASSGQQDAGAPVPAVPR